MKKILSVILILSIFLTSCLKDDTINTAGGLQETPTTIQFKYSGLVYFGEASVLTAGVADPIENSMVINVAGRSALTSDLKVTIAADDAQRVTYNATSDVKYEALPDSTYSIPVKEGLIPAGHYLDTLTVIFYPEKIDPTKNYMLPITIKDAQGQIIASNFSTYWYHTIGNPLAGNYNWDYTRWNNATGTGPKHPSSFTGDVTTFLPVDPTTIQVPTAYFIGPRYVLSFTNTAGVISNFSISMNADDVKTLSDNGVTIVDGPKILIADAVTGHYKFQFTVFNGTANRYLLDEYYK